MESVTGGGGYCQHCALMVWRVTGGSWWCLLLVRLVTGNVLLVGMVMCGSDYW